AIHELQALTDVDASVQNCSSLAYALGSAGRKREARDIVVSLEQRAERGEYVSNYSLALASTGLHDITTAIAQLERAVDERAAWLIFVNVDPRFASLRDHSRFEKILARVGL